MSNSTAKQVKQGPLPATPAWSLVQQAAGTRQTCSIWHGSLVAAHMSKVRLQKHWLCAASMACTGAADTQASCAR
jgi:hypothetical protein